jgi:tetratricopeptide (TPR) repeat protein
MKITRLAVLALALASPVFAQNEARPEPLGAIYERAIAAKDEAAISEAFKARRFEVINFIDGFLETWLANIEGSAQEKVAEPKVLLDTALDAAARADKALGGDGYSRYAKAWAGWTPEQQKQFRQGQGEYGAGRAAQKEKKLDEAKKQYQASLDLAAPLGDLWGEAQAHQSLGDLAFGANDYATAIEHFGKAKASYGAINHQGGLRAMRAIGQAHEKQGKLEDARKELESMTAIATAANLPKQTVGPVYKDLARICAALGDEAAAKTYTEQAAAIEAANAKKSG